MSDIKEGDLVKIKSGGVTMTVSTIAPVMQPSGMVNGVTCIWQEASGKVESKTFLPHVLVKVDA